MRPLEFRFQQVGVARPSRERGSIDERRLRLGSEDLALEEIESVTRRRSLVLITRSGAVDVTIDAGGKAASLEEALRHFASHAASHAAREALKKVHRLELFRSTACPACGAALAMAGLREGAKVYCRWCDTVSRGDGAPDEEAALHRCDLCGLAGPIRDFTDGTHLVKVTTKREFYRACPGCAAPVSRRMLLRNLPFVTGVPWALIQLWKSWVRSDLGLVAHAGLGTANRACAAEDLTRAVELYDAIIERAPDSVSVRINRAIARLRAGRTDDAVEDLRQALTICPSHRRAAALLVELGRHGRIHGIRLREAA